jgi:hypothetical protein
MVEHAHGVFLWVTLVLRELKELVVEGYSQVDLETRLRMLPTELEEMYALIIRRVIRGSRASAEVLIKRGAKMLTWVTFAERPLSIEEFGDAIAVPSLSDPFDPSPDFLIRNRIHGLELRMGACCGPLLEIRSSVVQLLHQTVRDFLLQKDKLRILLIWMK